MKVIQFDFWRVYTRYYGVAVRALLGMPERGGDNGWGHVSKWEPQPETPLTTDKLILVIQ